MIKQHYVQSMFCADGKKERKEKRKKRREEGDLWRTGKSSSFPEELHHSSVILRLLGQLLRPGHLHHLAEQVEGQIQGYRWVLGPPSPLHRPFPAVSEAAYERPDVPNFPL